MELEFAFLADAAMVTEKGLFCVISGGLDVLTGAHGFPATKSAMVLIARIRFSPEEFGHEQDFHAEIMGPDGNAVPPDMRLSFKPNPHPRNPERKNWTTIALQYEGVTFPTAGDYSFRLSIGNRLLGQVILEVIA
jgi:hypothetical protein